MIKKQKHFTEKGFTKIMELKSQMHKNRARRMREIRSSGGNGELTLSTLIRQAKRAGDSRSSSQEGLS